jgi:hypothetical protein
MGNFKQNDNILTRIRFRNAYNYFQLDNSYCPVFFRLSCKSGYKNNNHFQLLCTVPFIEEHEL